jgi:nucleoside 2-deoxyribosyltransferase
MIDKPLVYVAGYYSANPAHGTREACDAFEKILSYDVVPLVPHMSLLLDIVHPHDADFWYEYDLALLARCDAMFVIPNSRPTIESTGVHNEIAFCEAHGIPVVYTYRAIEYISEQWKDTL